ncbi:MAG: heavy metal-associated domain-containing protein [Dehalococcoidia bacterium]
MPQTITLSVTGMTCDHCVRAVTTAIKDAPGVSEATVSLETNSATVEGDDVDLDQVLANIKEEGYEATPA